MYALHVTLWWPFLFSDWHISHIHHLIIVESLEYGTNLAKHSLIVCAVFKIAGISRKSTSYILSLKIKLLFSYINPSYTIVLVLVSRNPALYYGLSNNIEKNTRMFTWHYNIIDVYIFHWSICCLNSMVIMVYKNLFCCSTIEKHWYKMQWKCHLYNVFSQQHWKE